MISDVQLAALEAAARSWIGTPFCEGTPRKGLGVSCHHTVAEVYFESGLLPRIAVPDGPSHWSPANTRSLIEEWFDNSPLFLRVARDLTGAELVREIKPGDALGFRVVNAIHHAAIALPGRRMVHSVIGHGVLIAPNIPSAWEQRLAAVWRLKHLA